MAKNEVAKVQEASVPAVLDFSADAGSGFEEADTSSFAIPFLRQLQSMSGQCKKTDPAYIKGAEEGDFVNTVTEKLYKGEEGVIVVPCHYAHVYNKWAPERGGYRGKLTASEYTKINKSTYTDSKGNSYEGDEEGNSLQDTREHYVLILNPDGTCEPALLSISGTEIKKSKKWMTLMQGIRIKGQVAPMFSQMYKLTAVGESNSKGSWAGIKVEYVGPVTSMDVYQQAKQFREMVRGGQMQTTPLEDEELAF